ncbi:MAG: Methionyl-tRNA formyltransferase, partial [Parcubacteria group bacterium GW2011_GWA2_56_21]
MMKKKVMSEQRTVNREKISFVFFGTPQLAVTVLDELEAASLVPSLVVTMPDEKKGRGLALTPPPVKTWVESRDITLLQPEQLHSNILENVGMSWDAFVVVAYGK